MAQMQHVSAKSLEDLPARVTYLSSFLGLTSSDTEALLASMPLVTPLVPSILDAVFVPKNTGFEGEAVKCVQELTLDSPQIAFRKDFLKNYLVRLVTTKDLSPESSFWVYLNNVGIMHTGKPGFRHREKKPELRVEYIHMGALLGYVIDIVIGAVMEMNDIDNAMKARVLRAFNKVLWIQNDLFARHYLKDVGNAIQNESTSEYTTKTQGKCPFAM